MSDKGYTSEDYFNAIAENVQKFIAKRSEEDIDKIRNLLGYNKPPQKQQITTNKTSSEGEMQQVNNNQTTDTQEEEKDEMVNKVVTNITN